MTKTIYSIWPAAVVYPVTVRGGFCRVSGHLGGTIPDGNDFFAIGGGGGHTLALKSDGLVSACSLMADIKCQLRRGVRREFEESDISGDLWQGHNGVYIRH